MSEIQNRFSFCVLLEVLHFLVELTVFDTSACFGFRIWLFGFQLEPQTSNLIHRRFSPPCRAVRYPLI